MSETEPTTLAVHSGALGDVVLFGRLLAALDGAVTLVAGGEKGRLLAGLGVVQRAMDFDALPIYEVFADTAPGDCVLPDLLGQHERLVSCFAAGDRRAELRLAAMCGAGEAAFLPIRPADASNRHLLDTWSEMLSVRCMTDGWPVPPAWREEASVMLRERGVEGDGYAVVHPGAGAADKCWPVEKFLAIAEAIECAAVFVLGPVEFDRWSGQTVSDLTATVPTVVCPALTVLAGLLAGARVYLGNDSGASHLAAAVGAPTVALFGPTRPEHFAPRGPRVTAPRRDPISTIAVSQVLDALKAL